MQVMASANLTLSAVIAFCALFAACELVAAQEPPRAEAIAPDKVRKEKHYDMHGLKAVHRAPPFRAKVRVRPHRNPRPG